MMQRRPATARNVAANVLNFRFRRAMSEFEGEADLNVTSPG
jgi:hypothetical protein